MLFFVFNKYLEEKTVHVIFYSEGIQMIGTGFRQYSNWSFLSKVKYLTCVTYMVFFKHTVPIALMGLKSNFTSL